MRKPALVVLALVLIVTGLSRPGLRAQDGVVPVEAPAVTADAPAAVPVELDGAVVVPLPAPVGTISPAMALQTIPSGSQVAVIRTEGMIYDFTLESMQRRVDRAIADGATVIVFELDTPGGVVTSAIDICKYIKNLPVPTIAWINNQAYSAGTMIASACDVIVMSRSASFGDSAPVTMGGELAPTERAKALSPVLAEYVDNAQQNGYDYAPFHAMCVLGIEVYYIENKETGERRLVNQVDYDVMVNGLTVAEAEEKVAIDDASPDAELARISKPSIKLGDPVEAGKWQPVTTLPSGAKLALGRVHDGSTLYTLSQTEAMDLELAAATVNSEAELQQLLGAARVFPVKQTWSESLAGFLTNPFVRGVLVLAVLVGAYIEFQAPGVGLPGLVAVIALGGLIAAPFVIGLAEVWHLILIVVGIGLLLVELLATPTFGLLGIVGVFMVIAGVALAVVPTGGGRIPLPAPGTMDQLFVSTVVTLSSFLAGLIAIVVLTNYYGKIPVLNRLVLSDDPVVQAKSKPRGELSGDRALGDGRVKAGDAGTVTNTGLRPTGKVQVGQVVVDAVSRGQFVDPDTPVTVVEVHGNRIVVDPVESV